MHVMHTPFRQLKFVASAAYSGTTWYLHASAAALANTRELQRLRVHSHFKNQHKGRSHLWRPSEYQRMLCNAYTRAIQAADADKNPGRWAELLEYGISWARALDCRAVSSLLDANPPLEVGRRPLGGGGGGFFLGGELAAEEGFSKGLASRC